MNASAPVTSRIPDFASREEEAAFWDTHDFTDYLDELHPVKVTFAAHLAMLEEQSALVKNGNYLTFEQVEQGMSERGMSD